MKKKHVQKKPEKMVRKSRAKKERRRLGIRWSFVRNLYGYTPWYCNNKPKHPTRDRKGDIWMRYLPQGEEKDKESWMSRRECAN